MASSQFRDSLASMGWSRREADTPASTQSKPLLGRLFGGSGGVRLPTAEPGGAPLPAPSRREEEEAWFALNRWDRLLVFGGCNLAAAVCFVICFFLLPVVAIRPRKFAILWSVGSLLFISSWAFLMGLRQYASHLISGPRIAFTATYFGSIVLTIYFAVGLRSTILTLLMSLVQLVALVWYLVSYFPMGSTGMRFASRLAGNRMAAWMNN